MFRLCAVGVPVYDSWLDLLRHGRLEGLLECVDSKFTLEWKFGSLLLELGFGVDGENDAGGSRVRGTFGVPPVCVWWSVVGSGVRRVLDMFGLESVSRDVSVCVDTGMIHWVLWLGGDDSNEVQLPWWRHGVFSVMDALFGEPQCRSVHLDGPTTVMIPLPEKLYTAIIEIRREIWKRPRSPFVISFFHAHVDTSADPIPHFGRGVGLFSDGSAFRGYLLDARSIPEAIGKVVASVLETRGRYAVFNLYEDVSHPTKH